MRGLDKVLDVSAERLNTLRKFAIETSAQVPVAARDLLELMSNAAQGGVPQEELEAFSLYVAKAAVAFDMAGGEIGDRLPNSATSTSSTSKALSNLATPQTIYRTTWQPRPMS